MPIFLGDIQSEWNHDQIQGVPNQTWRHGAMAHKGFNQPQYCVKKPTDSATGWFAIPWNQELFLGNTVTPLAKSLDAIINPIIPRKNLNLLTPTIAIPTSNHLSGLHCYIIRRVYHVFSVGTTHWNSQWNSHQIGDSAFFSSPVHTKHPLFRNHWKMFNFHITETSWDHP